MKNIGIALECLKESKKRMEKIESSKRMPVALKGTIAQIGRMIVTTTKANEEADKQPETMNIESESSQFCQNSEKLDKEITEMQTQYFPSDSSSSDKNVTPLEGKSEGPAVINKRAAEVVSSLDKVESVLKQILCILRLTGTVLLLGEIYVTKEGDTWKTIADKELGHENFSTVIENQNTDIIENWNEMPPGRRIFIPSIYEIQPKDTLTKIALKVYGEGSKWEDIHKENKFLISNPHVIYPGQKIVIPYL